MVARKLRLYFQSHTAIVLANQPLHQILQQLDCSGRLTKWAIEFGKYDIHFEPQKAINGQALADLIVECTHTLDSATVPGPEWMLFVDGASNVQGKGLML